MLRVLEDVMEKPERTFWPAQYFQVISPAVTRKEGGKRNRSQGDQLEPAATVQAGGADHSSEEE